MPTNSPTEPNRVHVALSGRAYDVVIGSGILTDKNHNLAALIRQTLGPAPRRAALVIDDNLPKQLTDAVTASLTTSQSAQTKPFELTTITLTATERNKSLASAERLLNHLAATRHERHEPVIALGGGIVGDVAGFAAAIYRRGVPVIQCPTTLLSMVDASVGGKTGVNLVGQHNNLLKNMAGAFHQPALVVADVRSLASLPERDYRSGLAECVKHALISPQWYDPTLLDYTEKHTHHILNRDEQTLIELVTRNVAVKARVVEADEHEDTTREGGRMLLNLGHTFAHALEPLENIIGVVENDQLAPAPPPHTSSPTTTTTTTRPPGLTHGEAVALGLVLACQTATINQQHNTGHNSTQHNTLQQLTNRVTTLLTTLGLPTRATWNPQAKAPPPTPQQLLNQMMNDKKSRGGTLTLILPYTSTEQAETIACRTVRSDTTDTTTAAARQAIEHLLNTADAV